MDPNDPNAITAVGNGWTTYGAGCASIESCTTETPFSDGNTTYTRGVGGQPPNRIAESGCLCFAGGLVGCSPRFRSAGTLLEWFCSADELFASVDGWAEEFYRWIGAGDVPGRRWWARLGLAAAGLRS